MLPDDDEAKAKRSAKCHTGHVKVRSPKMSCIARSTLRGSKVLDFSRKKELINRSVRREMPQSFNEAERN